MRPGPALSVSPVLSRRARIGDSGTRLTSAAHSHALQHGAPRLPLVPRRRPLAACSSALPTAAAAQRRAAAAASIVARERTRQRTVPVSRRDLGASWCRTRPITRYAAAVMRSFQTGLFFASLDMSGMARTRFPCESCMLCDKRSSVASSSTIDDGLPVVGVPTRAPGAADVFTILDTPSTRIGTVPWSARRRGLLLASRQLSTVGV